MLIFIDDSGDPGFKIERGSSRYFVIAAVIFDDPLEAEKTAVTIKELSRTLNFPDSVEFKFCKSKHEIREAFLKSVAPFKFRIRTLVIDKTLLRSDELKTNKRSFYSYAIKILLKHNGNSIYDAKIKIDGSGDRIFRKSFVSYLRQQLNSEELKVFKHCKLVDSKENKLIQMADMIAGTIKRSYEKPDGAILKKIIYGKIQDEWQFK